MQVILMAGPYDVLISDNLTGLQVTTSLHGMVDRQLDNVQGFLHAHATLWIQHAQWFSYISVY